MQNPYSMKERDMNNIGKEKIAEYDHSAIHQGEEKIREAALNVQKKIKEGQEQVKQIVTKVDKQLHENPWPIVAGVAATSLFLGFIMGMTKRNS